MGELKNKCDPAFSHCGAQKSLHKELWEEEEGVAGSCLLLPLPEALTPPELILFSMK